MGGSVWSDDYYRERTVTREATKTPTFKHDADIRTGKAARAVHAKLNPKGVKVRESRDSKEHPESLAISVILDVTGSMATVPTVVQQKLPSLMSMLTSKGYVEHPQILFGAVGDSVSDSGSVQIGQFESGIEMDDDISNLWLEGNGGGGNHESYQNIFYFFARHTSIDCHEKRGKKGYLFVVGDEKPYMAVSKTEAKAIFGDDLQGDIPTAEIIKECQEKYNVFFLIPQNTSYRGSAENRKLWEELVGADHVIPIQDESAICEAVALAVGLTEGKTTLDKARTELAGQTTSAAALNSVVASLDRLASAKSGTASKSKNVRL